MERIVIAMLVVIIIHLIGISNLAGQDSIKKEPIILFDIRTHQKGNELVLTAEIEKYSKNLKGCYYKLEVTKIGRTGSSKNVQSGEYKLKGNGLVLSESRLAVEKGDSIKCKLWIDPFPIKKESRNSNTNEKLEFFKEKIIVIER